MTDLKIIKNALLCAIGAATLLPASVASAATLSGNYTVNTTNVSEISTTESLKILEGSNIVFDTGVDLTITVEHASRWSLLNNADSVLIKDGATIEFASKYASVNANNLMGNIDISGTLIFRDLYASAGSTGYAGYGSANNYSSGGTIYNSGTVTIKNGGVMYNRYGTGTNICRTRLAGSSALVVESGGTLYAQGIELYGQNASITFEKGSSIYGNAAKNTTPFIIFNANVGYRYTMTVGDGFELSGDATGILLKNNATVDLVLDKNKELGFTINGFYSYDKQAGNSAELKIFNFANDYIKITDYESILISEGVITIAATNENWTTLVLEAIAVDSSGKEFKDGWYLQDIYEDGKLVGAYLNNSNFAIPEPSSIAAIIGVAVLSFALLRRKK